MWSNPVRLATSPGKSNRPTVVVTVDWHIWVGNENSEDLALEPMPLFGFGLGEYEDKVVEGTNIQIAKHYVYRIEFSLFNSKYIGCKPPTITTLIDVATFAPSYIGPIFCNNSVWHATLEAMVCRMCWSGLCLGTSLMTRHWCATMALLHLCAAFCTKCPQTMVWWMSKSWTTSRAPRWELQFGSRLPIIMWYFISKFVWPKYYIDLFDKPH